MKTTTPAVPAGWTVTTEWRHGRRHVHPGTELSIDGVKGRFRFVRHVRNGAGREWIDVVGGKPASRGRGPVELTRSFLPDRISRVHQSARRAAA